MSTIKSSDEHLTLNADGSSKDIKFQANGVEKASISSAGAFTSTTIDATKLTGNLPAISGAALTGVGVAGITSSADATAITIDSNENVGIGVNPSYRFHVKTSVDGDFAALIHNEDVDNGQGLMVKAGADSGEAILSLRNQASSEKFKVLADGYVLANKMATSYATCHGPAGNTNHSSQTATIMVAAENPDSLFNASNGRFTCPVDGLYFMSAMSINTASINNTIQAIAKKNGSEISGVGRMYESQNHNHGGSATSGFVRCNAGDYLQWFWFGSIYDGQHSNATFALIHGET